MSDIGPESAGTFWTRHSLSDHDDVLTTGDSHLAALAYDLKTSKWKGGADFAVPVLAAGANNGTSPPAPVVLANYTITDKRGVISFGSGGSAAAGAQVVVTFNQAMTVRPYVHVDAYNTATQALGLFVTVAGLTGFTISSTSAPTASQAVGTFLVAYSVQG